jgi:hypothetical protein
MEARGEGEGRMTGAGGGMDVVDAGGAMEMVGAGARGEGGMIGADAGGGILGSGASNGSFGIFTVPPVSCLKALAIDRTDATNISGVGSWILLIACKIRMLRGFHPSGFPS